MFSYYRPYTHIQTSDAGAAAGDAAAATRGGELVPPAEAAARGRAAAATADSGGGAETVGPAHAIGGDEPRAEDEGARHDGRDATQVPRVSAAAEADRAGAYG